MVVDTCNTSTMGLRKEQPEVQGHPQLYREPETKSDKKPFLRKPLEKKDEHMKCNKASKITKSYNPSTHKAEPGGGQQVQDQPGLHCELKIGVGCTVRPCLNINSKNKFKYTVHIHIYFVRVIDAKENDGCDNVSLQLRPFTVHVLPTHMPALPTSTNTRKHTRDGNIPTDSLRVNKYLNFTQEVGVADNSYLRSKTLYPQGHWIPVAEKKLGNRKSICIFPMCVIYKR